MLIFFLLFFVMMITNFKSYIFCYDVRKAVFVFVFVSFHILVSRPRRL